MTDLDKDTTDSLTSSTRSTKIWARVREVLQELPTAAMSLAALQAQITLSNSPPRVTSTEAVVERTSRDRLPAAGFVLAEKLAWQTHLYVDDLVTRSVDRFPAAPDTRR